jgi:hypothetical protein
MINIQDTCKPSRVNSGAHNHLWRSKPYRIFNNPRVKHGTTKHQRKRRVALYTLKKNPKNRKIDMHSSPLSSTVKKTKQHTENIAKGVE